MEILNAPFSMCEPPSRLPPVSASPSPYTGVQIEQQKLADTLCWHGALMKVTCQNAPVDWNNKAFSFLFHFNTVAEIAVFGQMKVSARGPGGAGGPGSQSETWIMCHGLSSAPRCVNRNQALD